MKIKKLSVSGFKNLTDCSLTVDGLHALTGPNNSGKSNLLQVIPFIAGLQSWDDSKLEVVFGRGLHFSGLWRPISDKQKLIRPLDVSLLVELRLGNEKWELLSEIQFKPFSKSESYYDPCASEGYKLERISIRKLGARGKMRVILERNGSGTAFANPESLPRSRKSFKIKPTMSAVYALQVRLADDFSKNFPVLAAYRKSLLNTHLLQLSAHMIKETLGETQHPAFKHLPGDHTSFYDPVPLLENLKKDESKWDRFCEWLKIIVQIDDVHIVDPEKNNPAADRVLMFYTNGRWCAPNELSFGTCVIFAIICAVFTFVRSGGALLLEEPENHLHPRALEDLMRLFRNECADRTVLFATHSPILLNSMKPEEVTLMCHLDSGFTTTEKVSEIKEAVAALNRGYLGLGELLQTDFRD